MENAPKLGARKYLKGLRKLAPGKIAVKAKLYPSQHGSKHKPASMKKTRGQLMAQNLGLSSTLTKNRLITAHTSTLTK